MKPFTAQPTCVRDVGLAGHIMRKPLAHQFTEPALPGSTPLLENADCNRSPVLASYRQHPGLQQRLRDQCAPASFRGSFGVRHDFLSLYWHAAFEVAPEPCIRNRSFPIVNPHYITGSARRNRMLLKLDIHPLSAQEAGLIQLQTKSCNQAESILASACIEAGLSRPPDLRPEMQLLWRTNPRNPCWDAQP